MLISDDGRRTGAREAESWAGAGAWQGGTVMLMPEHVAMLMVKERMEEALRRAEQARAIRSARVPRQPVRVGLGMALVRLGRWISGWNGSREAEGVRGEAGLEVPKVVR